jgi:hypothetical protein
MKNTGKGAIIGLMLFGFVVTTTVLASPVEAQITSAGPYYATPSWDQTLPTSTRFIILSNFASAAVLDRDTGLVWEKSPDTTTRSWLVAHGYCLNKNVGGTRGWRLPSVPELASLINPSLAAPFVPSTVFTGVQPAPYWSATTVAGAAPTDGFPFAWAGFFNSGDMLSLNKLGTALVWCVRGGMNADQY